MEKKVSIKVNAANSRGEQDHLWRWIGYDECNYSYIPEGLTLLKKFAALGDGPYYFRTHFMFCTGNCHGTYKFGSTNVYSEDEQGNPIYDFTYYDKIIDAYLDTGNKPFIELGFMPMDLVDTNYLKAISSGWEKHGQYKEKGWTCPPKDYNRWHDFIKEVINHLKEKYGEDEIKTWYYELWNEPDIFYWSGSTAEYCKLYDYTEHGVHEACSELRLSGPSVTGIFEKGHAQKFFRFFLNHCKEGVNYCTQSKGTRLDFITFHVKGGGFPFEMHAKKAVPSVESLVHQVKMGLDIITEYGYQDREVILSEADPDGWAAGGVYDNANMIFRNTEYYASYVASTYEKIDQLCRKYKMIVRPLAWAFMFPGERCFEGTRTFTTQGIDKAVFNLFKIYGTLGEEKLEFISNAAEKMEYLNEPDIGIKSESSYTGEGEETDISGFAVKGRDGETQIVIYSHNNDRDKNEVNHISMEISGLPAGKEMQITHYRIDQEHSNPYAEWLRQGSPLYPEGEQYTAIKSRDGLERLGEDVTQIVEDTGLKLEFDLPAHAVSYIVLK